MDYETFVGIIHKAVFSDSKLKLLESIARQPENFIGLFRPTKPEVKIAQNLSQSQEIKFGYAFEQLVYKYLEANGCNMFPRSIVINGDKKDLDIYFRKDETNYFVEQKMRDNHDSTKKKGQADDFQEKLKVLNRDIKVHGVIFFVDPGMSKNKKFYEERLAYIRNQYEFDVSIVYGKEFFNMLSLVNVWNEIEKYLTQWRTELPSFPEFNYDNHAEKSFNEIKDMTPSDIKKIFTNEEICKNILSILFPTGETLIMLADYWGDFINRKKDGSKISQLIRKRVIEMGSNVV